MIYVKTKLFSNTISVIVFIKIVVFNLQSKTEGGNRGNFALCFLSGIFSTAIRKCATCVVTLLLCSCSGPRA